MLKIIHLVIVGLLFSSILAVQKDYTSDVKKLTDAIKNPNSQFYHKAYSRLAYISDTYGPRMWGSNVLEQVLLQVYSMALQQKFDKVHFETVGPFTKWVRGSQELILHSPRPNPTNLKLIGLGGTVSGNIRAKAIVVSDYAELDARKNDVKGKIVVYNQKWTTYGQSVQYRSTGAIRAAQYGAVGALVRSVTPASIASVHAGVMHYSDSVTKIPFAAITVEDAEMMARMQARGQTIELQLKLQNTVVANCYSRNLIFEITGSTKPDEILLLGGHIDSWDTGSQTGANDDGGGFLTVFEALRLIMKNGLRPQRTLRFIAWSGQQWGDPNNGAHSYATIHANELNKHVVAFQDDLGSTKLYGFGYSGNAEGKAIIQAVASKYLNLMNATTITDNGEAADTGPLHQKGVPVMANLIEDTPDHKFYFTYHHSAGDSMTIMNPDDLDSNVLGVASLFYILADLNQTIPRSSSHLTVQNQ